MSDKVQGPLQLILVAAFIVASFTISGMLNSNKHTVQRNGEVGERALFVETKFVTPGNHRIEFDTTGIVEARAEVDVIAEVSGRVVSVNEKFFDGGTFEADEILFEINPKDFELEVDRLDAEVARARTTFNLEKAESEAAKAEWAQFHGSTKAPALVARKPQMDEAWANLKGAKAQLENAKLDLERTKFNLPFNGRVLSSELEQGQYIAAGQPYGKVYDISALEISASLQDKELNWLWGSTEPEVTIKAKHLGQEKEYKGLLKRGASALDPQTRFATLRFGFAEEVKDLLPGTFVTIDIKGPNLENVATIPISSLQKEGVIWKVNADNTLSKFKPTIIYANEDIMVVSDLTDSATIVTSKISGATEGMSVTTPEIEAGQQEPEIPESTEETAP